MDCKFHSLSSKRSRSILSSKYEFRHQWYGVKKLGRSSLFACIFNSLSNNFTKGWLRGKIYIRQISQAELQRWFLKKRNSFQVLKRQNKICLEYLFNDQSFSFFKDCVTWRDDILVYSWVPTILEWWVHKFCTNFKMYKLKAIALSFIWYIACVLPMI